MANAGPALARRVVLTDLVPRTLSVTEVVAGEGWECTTTVREDGTAVLCVLAELAPGTTASPVSITATVTAAAYPEVVNVAAVTATTPEAPETLADNTSSVTSAVPALTELGLTKELVSQLVAGRTGTYTLTVTNLGPTPEPGPVTVLDQLPTGLSYAESSWRGPAGAAGVVAGCTAAGQAVTCTYSGALAVGESVTFTVVVDVARDAAGTIVNTASIVGGGGGLQAPGEVTDTASGVVDRTQLPPTGAAVLPWILVAALLTAAGLLLVLRTRPRPRPTR